MQSSQETSNVNELPHFDAVVEVPPDDNQNCSSAFGEHLWKQSSTANDTTFTVDFPAMEFNEMPWLDTVQTVNTGESLTDFQLRTFGEDKSITARSVESKSVEVLAGSQDDSLSSFQSPSFVEDTSFSSRSIETLSDVAPAGSQEISLPSFQQRSFGEDSSLTARSIESKSDEILAAPLEDTSSSFQSLSFGDNTARSIESKSDEILAAPQEDTLSSFQSQSFGEDKSNTARSIESKSDETLSGTQEDSPSTFQPRSFGEDSSLTARSIESKSDEILAASHEDSLSSFQTPPFGEGRFFADCSIESKSDKVRAASQEDSISSFQSQSFEESRSSADCSVESKSDEALAGSQDVVLKIIHDSSPTPVPAQDSSSLLKIDVSAQEDLASSHETDLLIYESFPTLQESVSSSNYEANTEHEIKNTRRQTVQKIVLDKSGGDCKQSHLNNTTSENVEDRSVLRTWSSFVSTQSNSIVINSGLAQEEQELSVTFKDDSVEQKNALNLQSKVEGFAYGGKLLTFDEIVQSSKLTRSILDSVWQIIEDMKQRKTTLIVGDLQLALKALYTKTMSQNLDFGFLSEFHFLPLSIAFDVNTLSKNGTPQKITTDRQLFTNCYKNNLKNIILFGKPNYGKTTFCSCLAFNWTVSRDVLKCTLCVNVHVSQLKITTSVAEALVEFLCELLSNRSAYEKEDIRSALLSIGDEILFVIDGYDELFDDDERKMNTFLFGRTEFRGSTVLITTRPIVHESFRKRFERVLHLGGFNFNHLLSRLKASTISPIRIACFMERFEKDNRLLYLTELPPFFLNCACKLVLNFHYFREENSCVSPLLGGITNLLDQNYLHSSGGNDSIWVKLGKLMFEAVATGYSSFTEQLLRKVFSDKLDLLIKCCVFYKERTSGMWTVSSRVLMVFYATFYLRHCWSKLKEVNERQLFLDNVFCFGDTVGEYVTAQNDSPRVSYYVGVIPEVVLSYVGDGLIENAKFNMYHDVEAVELSQAFDSTNLLVRIGKRHITRFGFQELELDDPNVGETFQDIFECLSFSDFCVDYEAYCNVYEDRSFLNVSVTDGDDNNVLRFVCRAGVHQLLDRAVVEFDLSVLEGVFSFVKHVLLLVLNGIELDEDLVLMEPCELVWCLFRSIVKSDCQNSVNLLCHDYTASLNKRLVNFTFSIYKCPERKSATVEMFSTVYNEGRVSNFRVYKREEMSTENEFPLRLLKNWLDTAERPGISISIF